MQETGVLVSCCCVVSVLGELASISITSMDLVNILVSLGMHAGQRIHVHVCTRMGSILVTTSK